MRKFVALCALVLTACAPTAVASSTTGAANRAIPVTYFPTSTPFPMWTPLPSPTSPPTPVATATIAPTLSPTNVPVEAPSPTPQPPATTTPELVQLPTPAPVPTEAPPAPAATAIPIAQEAAPRAAAFAAPVAAAPAASGCSPAGAMSYDLVPIEGPVYKNNALTDENADLRLSILGYVASDAPLNLVDYNGATDADPPKLHGVFEPNRVPAFVAGYGHLNWSWNEAGPPPYGTSSGVNGDWAASVIDFGTTPTEAIHAPEREAVIWGNGVVALVLFASERELTLAYTRQDSVGSGYVVHMAHFCVDANLVATYRAQLSEGRRATGQLPGVRNNQLVGVAQSYALTVAIRDRGAFLDPRSRKDWW